MTEEGQLHSLIETHMRVHKHTHTLNIAWLLLAYIRRDPNHMTWRDSGKMTTHVKRFCLIGLHSCLFLSCGWWRHLAALRENSYSWDFEIFWSLQCLDSFTKRPCHISIMSVNVFRISATASVTWKWLAWNVKIKYIRMPTGSILLLVLGIFMDPKPVCL